MNFIKLILLGLSGAFLLPGCSSDKVPILKPMTIDTTIAVSYSAQIVPIIANNTCLSCHGPSSTGTKLHDYPNVFAKASTGSLYGAVSWNGSAQNMPAGGPKLPDVDIANIKRWIEQGAHNN